MSLKNKPSIIFRILVILVLTIVGCGGNDSDDNSGKHKRRRSSKSSYVSSSVDYKGKFRKGHVRKSVSLKKDAYKSQARSRYYYHTRGKYRKK